MSGNGEPTIHASAVLVGDRAVLIRGPSGAGKSRLAFELVMAGRARQIAPALLVGDDRIYLEQMNGDLIVRPAPQLIGLIEIRGLGIRSLPHTERAVVGLVVDLAAADAARMPPPEALRIVIDGVTLPRLPVGRDYPALPLVLAALLTAERPTPAALLSDCSQGIGNHISPTIATG